MYYQKVLNALSLVFLFMFADLSFACSNHGHKGVTIKAIPKHAQILAVAEEAVSGIKSANKQISSHPQSEVVQQDVIAQEIRAEKNTNTVDTPDKVNNQTKISTNSDLEIVELVLANNIEAREPKEIVENYTQANDKAYVFARLSSKRHSQITFVWLCDGTERNRFTTQIHAAKKWRTYASTKIRPGHWKVQLLSGNQVLAERTFTVR